MDYLKISFKSARLFTSHKDSKDFSFSKYHGKDNNFRKSRKNDWNFKEPITAYQVSNVIHCLFGERPVPSKREVLYKKNEYLFQKANDSYLKITTDREEITQMAKAVPDAWSKTASISWNKIRKHPKEKVDALIKILDESLNINKSCTTYPIETILKMIRERLNNSCGSEIIKDKNKITWEKLPTDDLRNVFEFLRENGLTFLARFIDMTGTSDINKNQNHIVLINRSIDSVRVLSGEILVPVTEDDVERLRMFSSGSCTILDGGMVTIEEVVPGNELDSYKFIRVGEISTEKTNQIEVVENK